jgi:hypothetical protein
MPSLRRTLFAVAAALVLASQAAAQEYVVTRDVRVHSGPSTGQSVVGRLRVGDTAVSIGPADNGYLHVRAGAVQGWAWGRFLQAAERSPEELQAASSIAATVSETWPAPPPAVADITNSAGARCLAAGSRKGGQPAEDAYTDSLKNRTDVPAQVHEVTFQGIRSLPYPKNESAELGAFTPAERAEVMKYSGRAVAMQGYLLDVKSEGAEQTNCMATTPNDVDWHMYVVQHPGDPNDSSVIAEAGPRIRPAHKWRLMDLRRIARLREWVRLSGWLMLDPEHYMNVAGYTTHAGKAGGSIWRATLWEIHPVSRIEVCREGHWVDLDGGPPGGACHPGGA